MKSEKANISIDFLAAVAILLLVFLFAITTVNNMLTPYSGYTKELYPTADRAVSLLTNDEGYYQNLSDGTDWTNEWSNDDYSNVKKIGFLKTKGDIVLDGFKIDTVMEHYGDQRERWWEFPSNNTINTEYENASRAMGLERYHFYMQIRPVGESSFDANDADQRASDMVGDDRGDVVSVVRYTMLNQVYFDDLDAANLYGLRPNNYVATKPLFGIPSELYGIIENMDGLTFAISNWTNLGSQPKIDDINLGDTIKNNDTHPGIKLDGDEITVVSSYSGKIEMGNNIQIPIEGPDDRISFTINESVINELLPNWKQSDIIYIQFNLKQAEVKTGGITWINSSFRTQGDIYKAKTILWVW
ncbi:MAG: hypothetical protein E4G94_12075 [ANME-2 cluster archaeon]|nr:MAG: hypothetical protein E4G94_12075 [ANME-2 cluster archaeon]